LLLEEAAVEDGKIVARVELWRLVLVAGHLAVAETGVGSAI